MATSISEFVEKVIYEIWRQYWLETGKVVDAFTADLTEIWGTGFWEIFVPIVGTTNLAHKLIATLDAFQEFQQDLTLVPGRIAVDVVDDLIPVPKAWSNRVFRGDQALRFFVREALDFAVDIQDMDLPAEVDVAKRIDQLAFVQRMKQRFNFDELVTKAKGGLIFSAVIIAGTIAKHVMALGVVIWAGVMVFRAHQADFTDAVLKERALPQDSERVVSRPRGARQHRVNRRPGPDK